MRYLQVLSQSCVLLSMVAQIVFVMGIAATGAVAGSVTNMPFLAHQAIYDLSLQKSRGNTMVSDVRGRILYNFSGSLCEGYTTDFRQVSELENGENRSTLGDLRSTSWEDADGKTYRFKIETRMNDNAPREVDGIAERVDDTVKVKLKQPKQKTFTLGGDTVFPTEQVRRIITAAKEGKTILELIVYDGSDNGEKVYNTLTVIGQPITPGNRGPAKPDATNGTNALKNMIRWPVTVSYYDRAAKPEAGEQTPVYAMSFELYENGVSRALVLDYNDFVLAGVMGQMDVKDTKTCK